MVDRRILVVLLPLLPAAISALSGCSSSASSAERASYNQQKGATPVILDDSPDSSSVATLASATSSSSTLVPTKGTGAARGAKPAESSSRVESSHSALGAAETNALPNQSASSLKQSTQNGADPATDLAFQEAQLAHLEERYRSQQSLLKTLPPDERARVAASLAALEVDISDQKKKMGLADGLVTENTSAKITPSRSTSIRSDQPRVPFYIPGTSETGVVEVGPEVSSKGQKRYALRFLDPSARNGSLRDSVELSEEDVRALQSGLTKLNEWTSEAQHQGIRKIYSKQTTCFPQSKCAANSSSRVEVIFLIYEDGSTGGQIRLHKGAYEQGYNLSIDSAKLLQANLAQSLKTFQREVSAKSASRESLDKVFN